MVRIERKADWTPDGATVLYRVDLLGFSHYTAYPLRSDEISRGPFMSHCRHMCHVVATYHVIAKTRGHHLSPDRYVTWSLCITLLVICHVILT